MDTQPAIEDRDRALTEALVRHRDEAAFNELYDRHTPRLLGFVGRILGRGDAEAEDVVQETWVRACENLARFRWNSRFSTWLFGIGLNVARDYMRRGARAPTIDIDSLSDVHAVPAAPDARIDLERAIALLPDGYRMILVLHDVEGMRHQDIADRLHISPGTSKSQLFHARRMMRKMLRHSQEKEHDER